MPTSIRPPPEMWSAVTADFASTEGCRKVAGETSVPRRSSEVTAERALIVAHASSDPRSCLPTTER